MVSDVIFCVECGEEIYLVRGRWQTIYGNALEANNYEEALCEELDGHEPRKDWRLCVADQQREMIASLDDVAP